jgi:hypothetical protein
MIVFINQWLKKWRFLHRSIRRVECEEDSFLFRVDWVSIGMQDRIEVLKEGERPIDRWQTDLCVNALSMFLSMFLASGCGPELVSANRLVPQSEIT